MKAAWYGKAFYFVELPRRFMVSIILQTMFFTACLLITNPAYAILCVPTALDKAIDQSDYVFVGKVSQATKGISEAIYGEKEKIFSTITLSPIIIWKGESKESLVVDTSNWWPTFQPERISTDDFFLVFANKDKSGKFDLAVESCATIEPISPNFISILALNQKIPHQVDNKLSVASQLSIGTGKPPQTSYDTKFFSIK